MQASWPSRLAAFVEAESFPHRPPVPSADTSNSTGSIILDSLCFCLELCDGFDRSQYDCLDSIIIMRFEGELGNPSRGT